MAVAALLSLARPCPASDSWSGQGDGVHPDPVAGLPQFVIHRTKGGLFIRLPILDLDPNTGVTVGLTPVWVQFSSGSIRFIHAAPATYNTYAGPTGAYHFIWLVGRGHTLQAKAGFSLRFDRDMFLQYESSPLDWPLVAGRPVGFFGRFAFSKNSTMRFYGIGPAAPKSDASNYTLDSIGYRMALSVPVRPESRWSVKVTHTLRADDVSNGGVESLQELLTMFPSVAREVTERRLDLAWRGSLVYDGRDSAAVTTAGTYGEAYLEAADKRALSEQSYYRFGGEIKSFLPWGSRGDGEPAAVSAGYLRFERLVGAVPFWLLPQLGGRATHRAYGAGRYMDDGLVAFGAEQRCHVTTLRGRRMNTSIWLDPFAGYGAVFPELDRVELKFVRPVYGVALRFVARPQIVGSAELGIGQEGAKVFLDVNYSF